MPREILESSDMRCSEISYKDTAEYRLGVRQLEQWHEKCRCKRLGIRFRPRSLRVNHDSHIENVGQ